jgi:hypothetical protein
LGGERMGGRKKERKIGGPHRGQNGHFTIRFDTVSSESIQNGTQVNELWVHGTQVSENVFVACA